MTIKLITTTPPPSDEGQAQVYTLDLPDELTAGTPIIGSIRIKNIGAVEDEIRCLMTTEWNGAQYQSSMLIPVGSALLVDVSSAGLIMPQIDAVIKIEGQHLEAGVWITDDIKSH